MNVKLTTLTAFACALALGTAGAPAPASAQTTQSSEQKADRIEKEAEQKADRIEKEANQKADQVRKEGDRTADQVRGKTDRAGETAGDKLDRAWDKTKETAREAKEAVTGADGQARNADVRQAQMALKDRGFDPGPIDGIMGPRTSAALREFQQKESLEVTGRLDDDTRDRLQETASASPSSERRTQRQ
jgi:hypothetical protein